MFGGGLHRARNILRVGRQPKTKPCAVALGIAHKVFACLCGATDQNDQNTGRHGIQRSRVTYLFGVVQASDLIDDVVRGGTGVLVDQQNTVRLVQIQMFFHAFIINSSSVRFCT